MNDEPKWDNEPKFDQMKRHFTLLPIDENTEKQVHSKFIEKDIMVIVSLYACLQSLTSCYADTDVPVAAENLFFLSEK